MTCTQQAEGNFWWQTSVGNVEGRLLKMPVCVVLASLRSCNAAMQNQLSFRRQAKTALCWDWFST